MRTLKSTPLTEHHDPRVAAMYRRLVGITTAPPTSARPTPPKAKTTASKPAKAAPPPRHAAAKPLDFSHLKPAIPFEEDAEDALPTGAASASPRAFARAVQRASAKAASPTGTTAPPMTAFARGVINAGRKARGEIATPSPTGFAAKVAAAARKARGEA